MNTNNSAPNRRSREDIASAVKRHGGAYRMHADPELQKVVKSTRAESTLRRMDDTGQSSPDQRRKGIGILTGTIAAGLLAVTPVGEGVGNFLQDTGAKLDANFDSHNLPPGGQPVEFRGGVAYEPGTDNTIVLPPVVIEP